MSGFDLYNTSEDYSNFKCSLKSGKAAEGEEKYEVLNPKSKVSSILALAIENQAADSVKEHELSMLDTWKDNFVCAQQCGKYSLQQYNAISAAMQNALQDSTKEKASEIYSNVYLNVVTPCIKLLYGDKPDRAYDLCKRELKNIFQQNFDLADV